MNFQSLALAHKVIIFSLLFLASPSAIVAKPTAPEPQPNAKNFPEDGARFPIFSEIAKESGLDFIHFGGISGEYYFSEILGAGGALFDYDQDGDLDVYLVQSHAPACKSAPNSTKSLCPNVTDYKGGIPQDRLYRNDLMVTKAGEPKIRFTDVTKASRIRATGYGMGVATGDFDNDGWPDLYVTNYGSNQLLRNNGDGTFQDITQQAGVDESRWSVSASFLDFDRDGWLDLFVGNYVDFSLENHQPCYAPDGSRDYCSPLTFRAIPCRLFRNRGDGTFEDVSGKSGILKEEAGALGVVNADFNGDGWPDIYVGNDGRPNQLWINQKDGTFLNESFLAGTAVNMDGAAEASMGVDAGDFDNDGDEDLFMTHLLEETNTLYVNDGAGWFQDRSVATGVAVPSQGRTAFGAAWVDVDNDSKLDLIIVNGDVKTIPELAAQGDPLPYHQPNQLLINTGNGKFQDISARAGPAFAFSEISRGAAFGDIDNDGDIDVLVTNNSGPVRLLRNDTDAHNHWLGIRLVDKAGRDALGGRVEIRRPGAPTLWRRARTDGSYASANDPRILVGLGRLSKARVARVFWPDGHVEEWRAMEGGPPMVDRYLTLRKGTGSPPSVMEP
uniref:Repeat domain-containing protein n=1 Tax=Candidatus Kentrum sp. SD TaxID=2126332 RepID=A0A450YSS9_9GAMM|nr:MAG: Repeat domain-containing protein [Candidatus Kentron sp. SD]VFK49541.1 MAG: Repeat domain-containing protein [Candidatus Kentron sp. SD]VFK80872.1 MAG: Repeat domain-containing protein [Candidatus Kentron sp. SD]